MRRVTIRRLFVVGGCLIGLIGVPGNAATAAPVDRSADVDMIARTGDALRQRLGGAFADYWLDETTGQLVVGVTDPRQAAIARALGATPRVVTRNVAALDAVMARLDRRAATAPVPSSVTGWYVDVTTNSVVVSVLGSDPAAAAFLAAGGDGVRVEQVTEAPVPYWAIIGGQAITTTGYRCSAGFNARSTATPTRRFVLTAGHCTNVGTAWKGVGGDIGTVYGTSFPDNDYGVIEVTNSLATSNALVDRYASGSDVTVGGSTAAIVGMRVCRSGSTTSWRCGMVQSRNQTVSYGSQVVYGLTRTNACAEPGDSGGSFVTQPGLLSAKVQAQGMASGGSGNCASGGVTFFQPVGEVLSRYGLSLYTG